jgi:hypothetical protein
MPRLRAYADIPIHNHAKRGQHSPTYKSWTNARKRCYSVNSNRYPEYGGRGIIMSPRWDNFLNFLADMGERPLDKSLDRIDPNGNYEPGNCKWSTAKEQGQHRRPNRGWKNHEQSRQTQPSKN